MNRRLVLAALVLAGSAALDGRTAAHAGVPGVVAESARTGVEAVRDGVLTFARTTRAFFLGGPRAAEETWYENAEATREQAEWNAARVREEAAMVRGPRHREYEYREYREYDDYDREYEERAYEHRERYEDEPLPPVDPYDGY